MIIPPPIVPIPAPATSANTRITSETSSAEPHEFAQAFRQAQTNVNSGEGSTGKASIPSDSTTEITATAATEAAGVPVETKEEAGRTDLETAMMPTVASLIAAITLPIPLPIHTLPVEQGTNGTDIVTNPLVSGETGQVPNIVTAQPTTVTQASTLPLTAANPLPETRLATPNPLELPGVPVDSHAKGTPLASGTDFATNIPASPLPLPPSSEPSVPSPTVTTLTATAESSGLLDTPQQTTTLVTRPLATLDRWFTLGESAPLPVDVTVPKPQSAAIPGAPVQGIILPTVAGPLESLTVPITTEIPALHRIEGKSALLTTNTTVTSVGLVETGTVIETPNLASDTGTQSEQERNFTESQTTEAKSQRVETPSRSFTDSAGASITGTSTPNTEVAEIARTTPVSATTERISIAEQVGRHLETMRLTNGHSEISLQLRPEHLGSVRVTIATKPEGIVAVIVAESSQAQQAIEGAKEQLRSALENRGFELSSLEVNIGQQATYSGAFGFAAHSETPQGRSTAAFGRMRGSSAFASTEAMPPIPVVAEVASLRSRSRLDYRA